MTARGKVAVRALFLDDAGDNYLFVFSERLMCSQGLSLNGRDSGTCKCISNKDDYL